MRTPKRPSPIQDPQSFSHLYTQTHLAVFRYIYSLHGGPREDVEELTSKTFLRAWKARKRFHGEVDRVLGWLLTIARNLKSNLCRYQEISTLQHFKIDVQ